MLPQCRVLIPLLVSLTVFSATCDEPLDQLVHSVSLENGTLSACPQLNCPVADSTCPRASTGPIVHFLVLEEAKSLSIKSPGYPGNYTQNLIVTWMIPYDLVFTPNALTAQFMDLDTTAENDIVTILYLDDNGTAFIELGQFSGSLVPEKIVFPETAFVLPFVFVNPRSPEVPVIQYSRPAAAVLETISAVETVSRVETVRNIETVPKAATISKSETAPDAESDSKAETVPVLAAETASKIEPVTVSTNNIRTIQRPPAVLATENVQRCQRITCPEPDPTCLTTAPTIHVVNLAANRTENISSPGNYPVDGYTRVIHWVVSITTTDETVFSVKLGRLESESVMQLFTLSYLDVTAWPPEMRPLQKFASQTRNVQSPITKFVMITFTSDCKVEGKLFSLQVCAGKGCQL